MAGIESSVPSELQITHYYSTPFAAVFSLVQVRLGLAKYVIKYKSTRDPPMNIDDKKREDKLTVDMKKALNAKPYSTAPPAFRDYYALNFFEDQMVANKLVQTALLNDKSSHSGN
jgi:chorismate mutase